MIAFKDILDVPPVEFKPGANVPTVEEFEEMIIANSKAGLYKRTEVIIDSRIANEFNKAMKKDKGPAFTLSELTITETKTGIAGTVKQDGNGYSVIITDAKNLSDAKKHALAKRMRNWYYYNHVQKK